MEFEILHKMIGRSSVKQLHSSHKSQSSKNVVVVVLMLSQAETFKLLLVPTEKRLQFLTSFVVTVSGSLLRSRNYSHLINIKT